MGNSTVGRTLGGLASWVDQTLVVPELVLGVSLLAAMVYKSEIMRPAATGPIFFAIVQHDAAVFALILLLYAASCLTQRKENGAMVVRVSTVALSGFLKAMCLLVVLAYVADVLVYHFFLTRLNASDIVTFAKEPNAYIFLLRAAWLFVRGHHLWKLTALAVVILLILRACFKMLVGRTRPRVQGYWVAIGALPFVVLWLAPVPGHMYSLGDKPLYENFMEGNKDFFVRTDFSSGFRSQILAKPPAEICAPGRGVRINVILLLVESLSAFQSNYFSGVNDWTPELDKIARRETALPNFYANGWTTIGGLISLLSRTYPFVPEHTAFNKWGSPRLTDFLDVPRSLPRALSKLGYSTEFVAAGDLSFLGQGDWLRQIGFQKLVGGDDPRFAKQKVRGPFNSVPDGLLYDVSLEEITQMPADRPYFMVVQTFWSHRPFYDLNGGHLDSEEPVIREADTQIGAFYKGLEAAGFFQKGLLFITGDHRAAEPFQTAEFKRFGASAIARIPGIIATRAIKLPPVITQDFQQGDFGASIESLVGDEYCRAPEEGSFLSDPPAPSPCILHSEGLDRDLILVKCGSMQGTVRVAGDATRFVDGGVPDEATVIRAVNWARARPVN